MLDIQTYTPPPKRSFRTLYCTIACIVLVGALIWGIVYLQNNQPIIMAAVGGPEDRIKLETESLSEERIRRLRTKQAVLSRREEILRYQLQQLQDAQAASKANTAHAEQLRRSRNTLVMLLKDQEDTDEKLAEFLRQVWEADGKTHVSTMGMETNNRITLSWPAEPARGISADYQDPYYHEMFGLTHEAIDIPLLQGTEVKAAADGVVSIVADNGYGYNYVIWWAARFTGSWCTYNWSALTL